MMLASLDSNEVRPVAAASDPAIYSAPGWLVMAGEQSIALQRFNTRTVKVEGDPESVSGGVRSLMLSWGRALSAPNQRVLAFVPGESGEVRELIWVDRSGKQLSVASQPGAYFTVRLAPDGRRILASRREAGGLGIWLLDPARQVHTKLMTDGRPATYPAWSPEGSEAGFTLNGNQVFKRKVDGTGSLEPLTSGPGEANLRDWSGDGRILYESAAGSSNLDLWIVDLKGDRKPQVLANSPANEREGAFAPPVDGKVTWVAYN